MVATADSFDEDDDDFQFTRIKPKKSKPTVDAIPELPQENTAPQPSPRRGRPPKKRPAEKKLEAVAESNHAAEPRTKRSTRGAAKTTAPEPEARLEPLPQPQPQPEPQPANTTRSTRNRDHAEPAPKDKEKEKKKRRGRPSKSNEQTDQRNGFVSPEPQKAGTATIALPMADTPVIQRNKEMRGADQGRKRE